MYTVDYRKQPKENMHADWLKIRFLVNSVDKIYELETEGK